jgi:proline iminopeptidase
MSVNNNAPNTGIIEREGYGLRYCIEGDGIPTLVIGGAIYYPRTFSKNLRKQLRLAFIDHRCFALPLHPTNDSTIELDAILDDMEYMRQKLNLSQIVVMGHSGHGYMALEYAKKYPEHVSHVVLIGHGRDLSVKGQEMVEQHWQESASSERKAALEENLRSFPKEQMAQLTPSQQFIKKYVLNGPRIWYDYKFDSTPLWKDIEINMPLLNHVWGTIFRDINITQGLEKLQKPIFLAIGHYDFLIDPSSWDPILKKIPQIDLHIFEQSGHTPQYEEADLFDKKLLEWILK